MRRCGAGTAPPALSLCRRAGEARLRIGRAPCAKSDALPVLYCVTLCAACFLHFLQYVFFAFGTFTCAARAASARCARQAATARCGRAAARRRATAPNPGGTPKRAEQQRRGHNGKQQRYGTHHFCSLRLRRLKERGFERASLPRKGLTCVLPSAAPAPHALNHSNGNLRGSRPGARRLRLFPFRGVPLTLARSRRCLLPRCPPAAPPRRRAPRCAPPAAARRRAWRASLRCAARTKGAASSARLQRPLCRRPRCDARRKCRAPDGIRRTAPPRGSGAARSGAKTRQKQRTRHA